MIVHKNYYNDARVLRYTKSLLKRGIQVDVICPPENHETTPETEKGLRVYTIPIQHRPRGRVGYAFEFGISVVLYFIYLSVLHIRKRYQVIHVHNMPDFLVFSGLIPRMLGAILVLDIHDPMPEVYKSKFGERANTLMHLLVVLQERLSCMVASVVITANSMFKANLASRGTPAEKITVVNNYPDLETFDRSAYAHVRDSTNETFALIYPGTIAPRYGLETAIRALPLLVDRIPDISLIIIGPESRCKDQLKQLINELGVSSYASLLPLVPGEEIPQKIAQADVGIYPALPDAHMNIATPTKVLEFAAMGIPIISSRLGIIEELFGNSSVMVFDSGDVDQFAQCVLELYESPSLREELVSKADQAFVQKHSWENEFQEYCELLNQLLVDGG